MREQAIREFMGEFMTPERVDVNNWSAFSVQISNTFPDNDHIRETIITINTM